MVAALILATAVTTSAPHRTPRPQPTVSASARPSPSPTATPMPPIMVMGCKTTIVTHAARANIGSQLLSGLLGRSISPVAQSLSGAAANSAGQTATNQVSAAIGLQNTTTSEIADVWLVLDGTNKFDFKPATHIAPRDFVTATATGSCSSLPVVIRVEFADGSMWYPPVPSR